MRQVDEESAKPDGFRTRRVSPAAGLGPNAQPHITIVITEGRRRLVRCGALMFRRKPPQPDQTASDVGGAPRAQTLRIGDQFELNLRTALHGLPYEVRPHMLLEDCLALNFTDPGANPALELHASKIFDFVVVTQRSSIPVLAIVLSTRSYGRDRRAARVTERDTHQNKLIVTVLHLNPHTTNTVDAIQNAIRPHL